MNGDGFGLVAWLATAFVCSLVLGWMAFLGWAIYALVEHFA